jgi:hypothetical protein
VLSDRNPLVISRQMLGMFAAEIGRLSPDVHKARCAHAHKSPPLFARVRVVKLAPTALALCAEACVRSTAQWPALRLHAALASAR